MKTEALKWGRLSRRAEESTDDAGLSRVPTHVKAAWVMLTPTEKVEVTRCVILEGSGRVYVLPSWRAYDQVRGASVLPDSLGSRASGGGVDPVRSVAVFCPFIAREGGEVIDAVLFLGERDAVVGCRRYPGGEFLAGGARVTFRLAVDLV